MLGLLKAEGHGGLHDYAEASTARVWLKSPFLDRWDGCRNEFFARRWNGYNVRYGAIRKNSELIFTTPSI